MKFACYFCSIYTAFVGLAIAADVIIGFTTQYGTHVGIGCNFYDALLVGIECRGFIGARAAELFLNSPLLLLYMLMLSFSSFWFVLPTFLLWFPPIFLLGSYLKRRYGT
jgi:hypothetical protein